MRSPLVPWILLGVVVAAWAATAILDRDSSLEVECETVEQANATLAADVARLQAELERLRTAESPTLKGAAAAEDEAAFAAEERQEAERASREAKREAAAKALERRGFAYKQSRVWYDAIHSLKDKRDRENAIVEIRAALGSSDPAMRLAALYATRGLGRLTYDRDGFRAAILQLVETEDAVERRAAMEALTWVKPDPEDLPLWIDEVQRATHRNAETTAEGIVRTVAGKVEGVAADAILHLLRDDSEFNQATLIRGLQGTRSFDPRLEARLIEIARGTDGRRSEATQFFYHFLGDRFDPMSDAMLDMILEHMAAGTNISYAVRALRRGLSETQKARAASTLITLAENAGTTYLRSGILEAFQHLDGHGDPERLDALAKDENADERSRDLAARAAASARRGR